MKYILTFILLIALFSCSHINHTQRGLSQETIEYAQDTLEQGILLETQGAVENLLVLQNPLRVYVGDSSGHLYLFSGSDWRSLELQNKQQLSQGWVLGITEGADGAIYCAASDFYWKEWIAQGGSVFRLSPDLEEFQEITGLYGGINGMTTGPRGEIYFTGSNMSFLSPRGSLYRMEWSEEQGYEQPELLLESKRALNGLTWNQELYCGGTFSGIFRLEGRELTDYLAKAGPVDAFDDFSVDSQGRLWMSDPISEGVKVYDRSRNHLINLDIPGLGILSSLNRKELGGQELLFLGEMRLPGSRDYDGRGVFIVELQSP